MLQQEAAPCACGPFYGGGCGGRCAAASPAFSLLFPSMPMGLPPEQCYYYHAEDGGCGGPAVDCTLSLATPSTRRAQATGDVHVGGATVLVEEPRQEEGSAPRRCANCDTTSTPLWRNGPRGPKSLCNACGIRYKKEERRAAAAEAPATQDSGVRPYAYGGGYALPPQQQQQWGCYGPAAGKSAASYGMYGGDVGVDGPCLSWMLNFVPSPPAAFAVRERERHTLFQYY